MYGMRGTESETWVRWQKLWQQDWEKSGAVQEPVAKFCDFRKQYCMYYSLRVPWTIWIKNICMLQILYLWKYGWSGVFQLGYILQNKKLKYLIIKVKNLEALVSKLALTSRGFPTSQGLVSEALQDVLLSRKFSASAIILKQSETYF